MTTHTKSAFLTDLATSGVLAEDQLSRVRTRFSDHADVETVARTLVDEETLTAWQAAMLLKGRTNLHLGPYRLTKVIRREPLARVFQAVHNRMQRPVAIKLLAPAEAAKADISRLFTESAKRLASVDHAHLVHVLDIAAGADGQYVVYDQAPATTLTERLTDGPRLDAEDAAAIARQILSAAQAMAAAGYEHGHLVPDRVMVSKRGTVKILEPEFTSHSTAAMVPDRDLDGWAAIVGEIWRSVPAAPRGDLSSPAAGAALQTAVERLRDATQEPAARLAGAYRALASFSSDRSRLARRAEGHAPPKRARPDAKSREASGSPTGGLASSAAPPRRRSDPNQADFRQQSGPEGITSGTGDAVSPSIGDRMSAAPPAGPPPRSASSRDGNGQLAPPPLRPSREQAVPVGTTGPTPAEDPRPISEPPLRASKLSGGGSVSEADSARGPAALRIDPNAPTRVSGPRSGRGSAESVGSDLAHGRDVPSRSPAPSRSEAPARNPVAPPSPIAEPTTSSPPARPSSGPTDTMSSFDPFAADAFGPNSNAGSGPPGHDPFGPLEPLPEGGTPLAMPNGGLGSADPLGDPRTPSAGPTARETTGAAPPIRTANAGAAAPPVRRPGPSPPVRSPGPPSAQSHDDAESITDESSPAKSKLPLILGLVGGGVALLLLTVCGTGGALLLFLLPSDTTVVQNDVRPGAGGAPVVATPSNDRAGAAAASATTTPEPEEELSPLARMLALEANPTEAEPESPVTTAAGSEAAPNPPEMAPSEPTPPSPSPESSQPEPAKPEPAKPEPKKPEPPKPAATKPAAAKPATGTSGPFAKVPDAVQLPAIPGTDADQGQTSDAATFPVSVDVPKDEFLAVRLTGGQTSIPNRPQFKLEDGPGLVKTKWLISIEAKEVNDGKPTHIATVSLAEGKLNFAWENAASLDPVVDQVRNTQLELAIGLKAKTVNLRIPETFPKLVLNFTNKAAAAQVRIPGLPTGGTVKVVVVDTDFKLDGTPRFDSDSKAIELNKRDNALKIAIGEKSGAPFLIYELQASRRGDQVVVSATPYAQTMLMDRPAKIVGRNLAKQAQSAQMQVQSLEAQALQLREYEKTAKDQAKTQAGQNAKRIEDQLPNLKTNVKQWEALTKVGTDLDNTGSIRVQLVYVTDDAEIVLAKPAPK